MSFSAHTGVIEPEQIRLLRRVLDRICESSGLDDFERSEVAARLVACFQSGHTDEESLFSKGLDRAAA